PPRYGGQSDVYFAGRGLIECGLSRSSSLVQLLPSPVDPVQSSCGRLRILLEHCQWMVRRRGRLRTRTRRKRRSLALLRTSTTSWSCAETAQLSTAFRAMTSPSFCIDLALER